MLRGYLSLHRHQLQLPLQRCLRTWSAKSSKGDGRSTRRPTQKRRDPRSDVDLQQPAPHWQNKHDSSSERPARRQSTQGDHSAAGSASYTREGDRLDSGRGDSRPPRAPASQSSRGQLTAQQQGQGDISRGAAQQHQRSSFVRPEQSQESRQQPPRDSQWDARARWDRAAACHTGLAFLSAVLQSTLQAS